MGKALLGEPADDRYGVDAFGGPLPESRPPPFIDNYISHTQYEFGSVPKFVEETYGLSSLGTTDVRAASIGDSFDFTQAPRKFVAIPSSYSRTYFEHQRPSSEPVDTE
ncbi:MAG: hypothetical protein WBE15_16375 [Candidatus Cybelea sp.]